MLPVKAQYLCPARDGKGGHDLVKSAFAGKQCVFKTQNVTTWRIKLNSTMVGLDSEHSSIRRELH